MKSKLITLVLILAGMLIFLYLFTKIRNYPAPFYEGMGRTSDWPLNVHFTLDDADELRSLPETPYGKDETADLGMFLSQNVNNVGAEFNKIENLPLRELTVKSSYNSAFDGKTYSISQLANIMANGCRFLDIQVFSANGGILYVCHSDTPRADLTDTSLPLSEVLGYISQYAFATDSKIMPKLLDALYDKDKKDGKLKETELKAGAPIQQTYTQFPLFINIRINRNEKSDTDIIDDLYTRYINPNAKTPIIPEKFFYRAGKLAKPIDMGTPLKDIKGKIIFMMDIDNIIQNYTTSYNADDVPIKVRAILQKFVNVKTGGHTWKTFNDYTTVENKPVMELYAMDNGNTTNCVNLYLAYPNEKNNGNPDALAFVKNHRIQYTPNRFYVKDNNLEKYEKFFGDMKKPFVPMADALRYKNGNSESP